MQLWKTAVLQIRSDAPAAAAELSLSAPPHCGHVVGSDFESDYEDQPCKPDIMGDRDIELDQQSNDDVELTCSDLGQTYEIGTERCMTATIKTRLVPEHPLGKHIRR